MNFKQIGKKLNSILRVEAPFPMPYIIPVYHCVSDERLPYLRHIINYRSCRQFEKDIDDMSKIFHFADWDFFKNNLQTPVKKPMALLTFDDGLSEFKENVLPILHRKGIYAINFINPAFVDSDDMMFRYKASLLIDKIMRNNFKPSTSFCNLLKTNDHTKDGIVKIIRSITYKKQNLLTELGDLIGLDFKNYANNHKIYMDLNDLNYVQNKGFGIASHSWDHPYFYELSPEEQIDNAQKSLEFIKKNNFLQEVFAFPFTDYGVSKNFFIKLFDRNPQLKYTFGVSGVKSDSVSRNLHRIPMETEFSAIQEINFESNYFYFKKLLNKNIVKR